MRDVIFRIGEENGTEFVQPVRDPCLLRLFQLSIDILCQRFDDVPTRQLMTGNSRVRHRPDETAGIAERILE